MKESKRSRKERRVSSEENSPDSERKRKIRRKESSDSSSSDSSSSSSSSSSSESSSSSSEDSSSQEERKPVNIKKENPSKWDSPERERKRARSRSGGRSRERERERNRETDRSPDRYRRDRDERERDRSRDRRDRHSERGRGDRDRYNNDRAEGQRGRDYRDRNRSPKRGGDGDRYRDDRGQGRSRDNSRDRNRFKRERDNSPSHRQPRSRRYSRDTKDEATYEWGKKSDADYKEKECKPPVDKEKPNFGLSGALTEDTNKVNGVVVKYSEPPEARKPKRRWRLYPFKGETALPVLHIHRQSCFLVGRDRKVADLAVDHPSCSKQHAALQYRLVPFEREDGSSGRRVRLYLIDLDSANGTFLNNKKIEPRKYYELMEKDVIKFGFSTREYVLLHENSKEDQEDDDIQVKQEPEDEPEGINQ